MFGLDFTQLADMVPKIQEGGEKVLEAFSRLEAEQKRQGELLEAIHRMVASGNTQVSEVTINAEKGE